MQAQSDLGQHEDLTTVQTADAEIAGFQGAMVGLGYWDSWDLLYQLDGGETVIKAARGLHVITNSRVVAELALYRIVGSTR